MATRARSRHAVRFLIRGSLGVGLLVLLTACRERHVAAAAPDGPPTTATQVVLAAAPAMAPGNFPCADCHEPGLPVRTARHELKQAHQDIRLVHGNAALWCFDCHDAKDRDKLHTVGGETVPYEEAQKLCGQCHGHQLRDWEHGAHGKRTGNWDGTATALRCVNCHAAHAPKFLPIEPMPAPRQPRRNP